MLAILVVIGTKYACNLDHDGDQICLQSWLRWGPDMPAILVIFHLIWNNVEFWFWLNYKCIKSSILWFYLIKLRFRQRIIKRLFYQVNHSNRKNALCVLTLLNLSSFQTDSDKNSREIFHNEDTTAQIQILWICCEILWDVIKSRIENEMGIMLFFSKK